MALYQNGYDAPIDGNAVYAESEFNTLSKFWGPPPIRVQILTLLSLVLLFVHSQSIIVAP